MTKNDDYEAVDARVLPRGLSGVDEALGGTYDTSNMVKGDFDFKTMTIDGVRIYSIVDSRGDRLTGTMDAYNSLRDSQKIELRQMIEKYGVRSALPYFECLFHEIY